MDSLTKPLPQAPAGVMMIRGTFCHACQMILSGNVNKVVPTTPPAYIHHETIASFASSQKQGCQLCKRIQHRLDRVSKEVIKDGSFISIRAKSEDASKKERISLEFNINEPTEERSFDGMTYVYSVIDPLNPEQTLTANIFKYNNATYLPRHTVRLLLSPSSGLDSREVDNLGNNSGSKESCQLATGWLQNCLHHHNHGGQEAFFPDRVLEIIPGESTTVKLLCREKKSLPCGTEPYATLSYCWGRGDHLKLTSAAMDQLISGVEQSGLPKTFTDAISMVQSLGIKYLWIDSLCILQDSRDDWKDQSAMMGKVYQNSRLTIAAAAATDSHDGLFFDRDPREVAPVQACTRILDASWPVRWYDIVDQNAYTLDVRTAPLNARGWVYQERMLSTRILHCTKGQLYWECDEMLANESWPCGLPNESGEEPGEFKRLLKRRDSITSVLSSFEWLSLVNKYSRCHLTKNDDILVAISGIAKSWGAVFPDKYLAGLWQKSLPYGLLWYGRPSFKRRLDNDKTYRAPSWSWASVAGETVWSDTLTELKFDTTKVIVLTHLLENTTTELDSADPTGAVRSGNLVLQTAFMKGEVGTRPLPIDYRMSHVGFRSIFLRSETTVWMGACCFDTHEKMLEVDQNPKYPLFCLPMILTADPDPTGQTQLATVEGITTEKDTVAKHRRIGYFWATAQFMNPTPDKDLFSFLKDLDVVSKLRSLGMLGPQGYGFYMVMIE
ncbi:heterokaryon incompatibility protein-domain-containing protein [Stachybotrys elegans]|uniref:Heterokaryon incompatibility protein-domain-containing protein n=1 Tax=Stachybotrys elegans TaxID=80388 RepID=A0A8K0WQR8_9HYPO|nr:heterokaryon incompatibility protein-domain-containing protein [Stachybotrys elegans]